MRVVSILIMALTLQSGYSEEKSPKQQGYTFPDEWEAHTGTMMIFPAREGYGKQTNALRREFHNVAAAIAQNEPVIVFCRTEEFATCQNSLGKIPNLTIKPGPFQIDWARDNAPMVLVGPNGQLASAGFRFNGWGKKYRGWKDDADTRDDISRAMKWPVFHSDFVLEGGSIEIGDGIGIVTESCVLNPNRTDWTKAEVTRELTEMLGLKKIIWLPSGLMPDPVTDGHVDGLCKWVAPNTVLLHSCDLKSDPNYTICLDAKKILQSHGINVIDLPLADDIVHMNYYLGSGGKVAYVPTCGDPAQDDPALAVIRKLHPKVVPIKSVAIAKAGGGIHCYTQQIPSTK
ncbi:MAG: agmatine deiminase family protein [Verrucomicrobiaceae bacterium]